MGWIRNKRQAMAAVAKGRIVDEVEDNVPAGLVRHLRQCADGF